MRAHFLFLSTMFTVSLFASACSDDEESKAETVESPQVTMSAKTVGETSTSLTMIPAGADQTAGQAAFSQVGSSIQLFANQYQAYKAQQAAGNNSPTGGLPGQLRQGQNADDGQFSFVDNHLVADVNYDSPQGSIRYVVDLTLADVDGGRSIDGSFSLNYKGSNGGYDIDYNYDATYDAVTISEGCAASGTLSVDYDFKVSGDAFNNLPPQAREQIANGVGGSGTITATFGPTCADIAITGN